jgi:hypothetical protein
MHNRVAIMPAHEPSRNVERLTGIYGSVSVVPGGQEVADSRSDGNAAAHPADSAHADTTPQAGRRARLGAERAGSKVEHATGRAAGRYRASLTS